MSTPIAVPKSLSAGTTLTFTYSDGDHPASDGWTHTFYLNGGGAGGNSTASAVASGTGSDFAVTLAATSTDDLKAGDYAWALRAAHAGVVVPVANGRLTVTPDIATAAAGALKSPAQIMLEAVEGVLAGLLSKEEAALVIGNRSAQFYDRREWMKLRTQLRHEVRAEKAGGYVSRPFRFTFGPPRS